MIRALSGADVRAEIPQLAETLRECVESGASVGFVMPFSQAEAEGWFRRAVLPGVETGGRVLWAAFEGATMTGTVQLCLDMMPNQIHRAEVSKLLVRPAFRRRGIARALMGALLTRAGQERRALLTLDTRSGDSAQPLYAALGFCVAGEIPGFALAPDGSARCDATTYMYRTAPAARRAP